MITISFIIPVYNVEKYVKKCLDSILTQIDYFPGSEIIIVNDGTMDNSMSIIEPLALENSCIHIINQENGGLSRARNTGIEAAKCDYIWLVDSDDWLEKDALKILYQAMSSYPGLDLYVTALNWTVDGKVIKQDIRKLDISYDNGAEYIKHKCAIGASPRFITKRSLLVDNCVRFLPGVLHEDAHYGRIMPFFAKGVYVLPAPVYGYRQRAEGSIMHSIKIKSAYDCITIHKSLMKFADAKVSGEERDWFRYDCRKVLFFAIRIVRNLWNTEDYRQFISENGEYIRQETLRNVSVSSGKSKLLLYLFAYCPRIAIILSKIL